MTTKISLAQAYARVLAYSQSPSKAESYKLLLEKLSDYLPSGSGFDCGTELDLAKSLSNKLVFQTEFHHMTNVGFYDGWSSATITVKPLFEGFDVQISTRNLPRWEDKFSFVGFLAETFCACLEQELDYQALFTSCRED